MCHLCMLLYLKVFGNISNASEHYFRTIWKQSIIITFVKLCKQMRDWYCSEFWWIVLAILYSHCCDIWILLSIKYRRIELLSSHVLQQNFHLLSPGWSGFQFELIISKCNGVLISICILNAKAFMWMLKHPTDDKSHAVILLNFVFSKLCNVLYWYV